MSTPHVPLPTWMVYEELRPSIKQDNNSINFRIADTFTDSLAKLTAEKQKAVKTTAFDLQMNHGRIAVKVINHLGDEVMKVFRVE